LSSDHCRSRQQSSNGRRNLHFVKHENFLRTGPC
jgi:hypothetical protein